MVNRTYGRNDEWRAHPVNREVTLKAGEFGTLEMTFFLHELIPRTDSNLGLHGTFRVDIYPALRPFPEPPAIGFEKCYFF
jgi:hypothetical protein